MLYSKNIGQTVSIAIIAGQLVVGGAERQLYLWLSHLDQKKFRPVVVTLHPGYDDYWESRIEALGIPLLRIPHRSSRMVRLLDIVRVLRPYKPQLVQGWHLFASPYAGMTAKLLGAKSLGGLRDAFRTLSNTPLESALTLYLVDAILANSRSAAKQLLTVRKRKNQIIYAIQNAVEDRKFHNRLIMREQLKQQFGIPSTGILLGSLGRLDPKKRFDLLLKAIALLSKDCNDFHFLLIGDGPERLRLARMAETLAITNNVIFAGEISGGDYWLKALDIFCFASLDEGLPNAVMEAAIAGIPIVSWRVPFMEELLDHDKSALMAEPQNLAAFKEYVLELIKSTELQINIGQAGRNYMLENFTIERYVQQMTAVYEELLGIQPAQDCRI